jgi:hypothetical protein
LSCVLPYSQQRFISLTTVMNLILWSVLIVSAVLFSPIDGATTLFNGQQAAIFPIDTPQTCQAAFDTSISCDTSVQLLIKQTDWIGWNATNLTALCTRGCRSSLVSLQATATSACAGWSGGNLGAAKFNTTSLMQFLVYKYDMTCLMDGNSFCYIQRQNWDIAALNSTGKATWPKNTNKTYYDWNSKHMIVDASV